ncbi:MAG: hypothetical protein A2W31_11535 [Planctomycetes bacterium RBG_16_64_10]|nr:MAG: hypothetical protein A2W31_11535 [Planctomycetes bacterium RBG_16_64_10]
MEGGGTVSDTRPRWPNQLRAYDGTTAAIGRGVTRLCVTSPTGTGKTTMMTDVIEHYRNEGKRISLYTVRRMLYSQIARNLERDGFTFGRIASGHDKSLAEPIQLCMMQTDVSRRKRGFDSPPADIVIADEYHVFGGPTFQDVIQSQVTNGASLVAYTATPIDLQNIDELLIAAGTREMIQLGSLVPAHTFAPDEPDLRHIKKYQVGEDISDAENHKAIMRPGVFARVIGAWKAHNPDGLPTILFGPDVAGSKFFAEEFAKAGIRSAHIDGEDVWLDGETYENNQDMRDQVADLSKSGEVKVVCNRFVLREGIDWPWIQCGIFATVFGALSSFIQSGGRLLRAYPGKDRAIVLDHGGNWHRHGSLNEDREWTLESSNRRMVGERQDKLREKREDEPIVCPKCNKVRSHGRTCTNCGYMAVKKSRVVIQKDGTLKEMTGDIYKPRYTKREANTADLWKQMYFRARSQKWAATFRQAEAMFVVENHYWPPRDLPLMPKDPADMWRKVADVPREALL